MKARLDPVRYARLFEAEFSEDLDVFRPAALIDQATARDVTVRPRAEGVTYVAALDANAGGEDAFAVAIAHLEREQGEERVIQDYGQAWEKSRGPTWLPTPRSAILGRMSQHCPSWETACEVCRAYARMADALTLMASEFEPEDQEAPLPDDVPEA